jgi:DCN1-like protein 1/2
MWSLFIPPALTSSPSALSRLPAGVPASESSTIPPDFTEQHFQMWLDFQKSRGKAVSKDTWSLLVDFIRSIDKDFKEYDDSGEWH